MQRLAGVQSIRIHIHRPGGLPHGHRVPGRRDVEGARPKLRAGHARPGRLPVRDGGRVRKRHAADASDGFDEIHIIGDVRDA